MVRFVVGIISCLIDMECALMALANDHIFLKSISKCRLERLICRHRYIIALAITWCSDRIGSEK